MENSNQPEEQEDGGAIFLTTMQKGSFGNLSPVKTRKRKKTEVVVSQARCGGARIIRSAGRKDRHSKVCTARGTRDRRVRLAPKTAIDFYDVQDRLGYDRPSKAIDWLMNEARAAIAALDDTPPPPPPPDSNVAETQQTRTGDDDYNNEGSFGILKAPAEFQGLATSAAPGGGETFDATLEMAKMQRIFAWNYGNAPVTAHSNLGHGQMIREPLQSSYSRIANYYYYNNNDNNNSISARFPGIEFSNEELTIPENNEMDNNNNNPINYYYPASFLQHEH